MPDAAGDAAEPHSAHHHGPRHHSHPHATHHARRETFRGASTAHHHEQDEQDGPDRDEADYYAVLGLARNATPDDVRRAYHRLAKLWHPDRFMAAPPDLRERAERRTRALNAAHAVLGDPALRATYDLRLPLAAPHHAASHDHAAAHTAHPELGVRDVFQDGRATVAPDHDGTGMFLGGLLAVVALVLILAALKQYPITTGAYLTLGLGFILAGMAFWCATQENLLTRLANQVLAGAPPVPPSHKSSGPGHPHGSHPHPGAHPAYDMNDVHQANGAHAASHQAHGAFAAATDPDDEADAAFEQLVGEAVESIPNEFKAYLNNVVVRMKRTPSAEDIARLSIRENGLLLGLYEGVDVTRQGAAGAPLPEVITIYRRPIECYCRGDPNRIRVQIRRTVLHELAHHFGIDHEAMPDWIR